MRNIQFVSFASLNPCGQVVKSHSLEDILAIHALILQKINKVPLLMNLLIIYEAVEDSVDQYLAAARESGL